MWKAVETLRGEGCLCFFSYQSFSKHEFSTRGKCAVKMNWKESWGLNVGQCAGAFLSPFAGLKHDHIYLFSFMTVDQEQLAPSGTHQSPETLFVWKVWWRFFSLIPKLSHLITNFVSEAEPWPGNKYMSSSVYHQVPWAYFMEMLSGLYSELFMLISKIITEASGWLYTAGYGDGWGGPY